MVPGKPGARRAVMLRATGGGNSAAVRVCVLSWQDLRTSALGRFQQFPFGVKSGSVGEGTLTVPSPAHTGQFPVVQTEGPEEASSSVSFSLD